MRLALLAVVISACGRLDFDAIGDGGTDVGSPFTVTVTVVGNGAVVSVPPGISCGSACSADFTAPVTLDAIPSGALDIAWQGAPCSGGTCTIDGDAAITVVFTVNDAANRVFLTSTMYDGAIVMGGDVNGVVTADRICQTTATTAGLDGTFVAFLSSSTISRNATDPLAGSSGWIQIDGRPLFGTIADIVAWHALSWLDQDITGSRLGTQQYSWLGGGTNGQADGSEDCGAYTNTVAMSQLNSADELLSPNQTASGECILPNHITCIEIGKIFTLQPGPPLGRRIFVSSIEVNGDIGIAAADAQCQADADSSALAGSYRALLATSTTSAADHVGGLAGPWQRTDNFVITTGALDVTAGPDIAILLGANGVAMVPGNFVWVGSSSLDVASTETCNDWSSTMATDEALIGMIGGNSTTWAYAMNTSCTVPAYLYCVSVGM